MAKDLRVVTPAGEGFDVTIEPGTTARDVLRKLNLDGYAPSRDGSTPCFKPEENLYPEVKDGEKLFATPEMKVS